MAELVIFRTLGGADVGIDPKDVERLDDRGDDTRITLRNGDSYVVNEPVSVVSERLKVSKVKNERGYDFSVKGAAKELKYRLEKAMDLNNPYRKLETSDKLVLTLTDGSVEEVPASRVLAIDGQPRGECRVDVLEAVERGGGEDRVKSARLRMYQVAEPFDVVSARLKQVKDMSSQVEDSESNVLTLTDGSRVCVRREDVLFISQSMAEGVTVGLKDGTKYSVKDWHQDIHDWFERGISETDDGADELDSDTDDTSSRIKQWVKDAMALSRVAPAEDSKAESCKDDTPKYEVTTITSSLVDSENDSPKETPNAAAGSVVYLEREEWDPDALRYVDDKVYEFETVRLLKIFLKHLNRKIETGSKQAGVLRVAEFSELFDLAPFHVRTLLEIKRTVTGLIGRVTDNGVEPNWEGIGEEWVVNPNPPSKFDREVNAYLYLYRLFGQKFIESAFYKGRHCSIDPEYISLLCNVSVGYVHRVLGDAMHKTFYLNLNSEGNYELVGRENK